MCFGTKNNSSLTNIQSVAMESALNERISLEAQTK